MFCHARRDVWQRAGGSHVTIVLMTYHDPRLASWHLIKFLITSSWAGPRGIPFLQRLRVTWSCEFWSLDLLFKNWVFPRPRLTQTRVFWGFDSPKHGSFDASTRLNMGVLRFRITLNYEIWDFKLPKIGCFEASNHLELWDLRLRLTKTRVFRGFELPWALSSKASTHLSMGVLRLRVTLSYEIWSFDSFKRGCIETSTIVFEALNHSCRLYWALKSLPSQYSEPSSHARPGFVQEKIKWKSVKNFKVPIQLLRFFKLWIKSRSIVCNYELTWVPLDCP